MSEVPLYLAILVCELGRVSHDFGKDGIAEGGSLYET